MKISKIFVCIFLLIFSDYLYAQTEEDKRKFVFFESTAYVDKSSFYSKGFIPIEELGSHLFWPNGEDRNNLPNRNNFCFLMRSLKPKYELIVIDIENWPLSTRWASEEIVNQSIKKYITVVNWAKQCRADLKFGFYGQIPISDHKLVLKSNKSKEKQYWKQQHGAVIPIAHSVDAIFPSLYTLYEDQDRWIYLAKEYIKMARVLAEEKPVYPYIWPQYHEGNKSKKGTFLDRTFWRKQLELVYELADGVVVWGGWDNGPMQWDENAEWWQETKNFIMSKNSSLDKD